MSFRVLLGLALGVLIAGTARADTKTRQIEPGIAELRIPHGNETGTAFFATQPPTLITRTYPLADGDTVCVFQALANRTYVLVAVEAPEKGQTRITTYVLRSGDPDTPGPTPDPTPPTPSPRPPGFAGEVYDAALLVNQPSQAKRIAAVFLAARSELAAVTTMTPTDSLNSLSTKLRALQLPAGWTEFGSFLNAKLQSTVRSRETALDAYEQIATGLEASAP